MKNLTLLLILLAGFAAPSAQAEDGDKGNPHLTPHHPNRHAAVFLGRAGTGTHASYALGGDFEFRLPVLNHRIGAVALFDAVFAEHTHVLAGAGLVAHPAGNFRLLLAPAVASEEGHTSFVVRSGIGYDIHVGRFAFTPALNLDYADGHVTRIVGLSVGTSF